MEEQIAKAYMSARRFDEGEIIQDEKYTAIRKQQRILEDQMIAAFGKGMEVLLEDYACAIYDEMELEAQHFFQEGYRAAKDEDANHSESL